MPGSRPLSFRVTITLGPQLLANPEYRRPNPFPIENPIIHMTQYIYQSPAGSAGLILRSMIVPTHVWGSAPRTKIDRQSPITHMSFCLGREARGPRATVQRQGLASFGVCLQTTPLLVVLWLGIIVRGALVISECQSNTRKA